MNNEQKYFNSYYPDDEMDRQIDEATENKMAILEDIFNSSSDDKRDEFDLTQNLPFQDLASSDYIAPTTDEMEHTKEIDSVELDKLRRLKEQISEMDEDPQLSEGETKGKQKVLSNHPGVKFSDDVAEITSSFMNCFALAFVTAAIGAGWLVNLIMHIK